MNHIQKLERIGSDAVRKLCIDKLHRGIPFMINAKELPPNQCYLEFPDRKILLVTISPTRGDFLVLRELSNLENANVRKIYDLV